MSGREWKPGDVAMVTTANGDEFQAVRTQKDAHGNENPGWQKRNSGLWLSDLCGGMTARPVAVIDPDAHDEIQRLWEAFAREHATCGDTWVDSMQAALREFADPTPPKPEEPTGLGAVVEDAEGEDAEGDLLVRVPLASDEDRWFCKTTGEWFAWSDITAVKVLSDGYDPEATS